MTIKAVDLFCGVGGLTYGLQKAGIPVVAGIDIDDSCEYAYTHNNNCTFIHKSVEVKEMAIRVFENWNTIESYTFLKNCTLTPAWLEDYKNEVLANIEEELCLI